MKIPMFKFSKTTLAVAFSLALGCESRTLEDCLTDSSKAPTSQGVTVAATACYQKFAPRASAVDEILKNGLHCDEQKLVELSRYLRSNSFAEGTKDFEKIQLEYQKISFVCQQLGVVPTAEILSKSVSCDEIKEAELAQYIVINQQSKGQPEFEVIANEYRRIRQACIKLRGHSN